MAFKIINDSYVGKLTFVRLYSGTITKGQNVYNPRTAKRERVGRILQLHANHREDVDTLYAGEIGAIAGLKKTTTGDTLCSEQQQIVLESIEFPEPVIAMAIEPKTTADKESLAQALSSLADEDPTFQVSLDEETGQTIISGMGELHLEILKDRMFREYNVQANAGKPMVAYREAITQLGQGAHTFDREIGGKHQCASLQLSVEPLARGEGNQVLFSVTDRIIPGAFRAAIEKGITDGLATGALGNYALVDVKVTVTGGEAHLVDSTETAFQSAAVMALRDAVQSSGPVLLEPIMAVEVLTPEEHMGDILNDLNSRRGRIREMQARDSVQVLSSDVPLAELFGYATGLRSLSKGRASYSMEPSQFEAVPENLQQEILNR